jgi:hypothetical protein
VLHIGLRLYLVTQTTLSHGEELEQAITVVGRGSGSGGHSQRRGGSGVVGRRRRGASRGADRGRRQVSQNGEVAVGAGFGRPSGGPKAAGGGGGANTGWTRPVKGGGGGGHLDGGRGEEVAV